MADATTERPNKVEVTDAGPCKKKLRIEVPAATIDEQLGSSMDTVLAEAELPGFRKGRAPRRLVEKKFGTVMRREAKNQIVSSAFSKAVEEHKLQVVGDPVSEMLGTAEIEPGKAFVFEIDVEVVPAFELPSLEGISVKRPKLDVTDEMVNKELETIRLHEGDLEPREAPEAGDYLTGHAVMTDSEGTKHLDINDAVVQAPPADRNGKGMILGISVDDFGKQLGLPKQGQTATIRTKGPENHETEAIRGKDLTITFEVSRVDRIIPASLDSLVSKYGFEDEAALRDSLKQRLQQRILIEQQTVMRNQAAAHLLKTVKMEMPERLTAQQAGRALARRRLELLHRGVDAMKIEEHMAQLRASSASAAARDLKMFFILGKAADALSIKVSDAEINGRIHQMAMQRGVRPEKLRQELIQRDQVGMLFVQIREHKTMDAILAKANFTDMSPEEFNKAMADEANAGA
jgi:trigger factor